RSLRRWRARRGPRGDAARRDAPARHGAGACDDDDNGGGTRDGAYPGVAPSPLQMHARPPPTDAGDPRASQLKYFSPVPVLNTTILSSAAIVPDRSSRLTAARAAPPSGPASMPSRDPSSEAASIIS